MSKWANWKEASCLPDCWCEAPRFGQWILEPVNTWTNISYFIVFALILWPLRKYEKGENALVHDRRYDRVFAFAMLTTAIGSTLFHASLTFAFQWLDVLGMYLITFFYIIYQLLSFFKNLRFKNFILIYLLINCILGFVLYYLPETRRYLFGISIFLTLILSFIYRYKSSNIFDNKQLIYAFLSLLIAQIAWWLDKLKIVCDPYGAMTGHGIWHFLAAASSFYFYRYLKSEKV